MRAFWITSLLIFALDQVSKWAVLYGLNLLERGAIDVLPPFLNLRMAWNTGVNFGMFAGGNTTRWLLVALALGIVAGVIVWLRRNAPDGRTQIAAGLLVGGALGNVIDRVIYGAVADFLNMSCCGISNPYAFNVADIAIFAGAIGLVIFADGKDKKAA